MVGSYVRASASAAQALSSVDPGGRQLYGRSSGYEQHGISRSKSKKSHKALRTISIVSHNQLVNFNQI